MRLVHFKHGLELPAEENAAEPVLDIDDGVKSFAERHIKRLNSVLFCLTPIVFVDLVKHLDDLIV